MYFRSSHAHSILSARQHAKAPRVFERTRVRVVTRTKSTKHQKPEKKDSLLLAHSCLSSDSFLVLRKEGKRKKGKKKAHGSVLIHAEQREYSSFAPFFADACPRLKGLIAACVLKGLIAVCVLKGFIAVFLKSLTQQYAACVSQLHAHAML